MTTKTKVGLAAIGLLIIGAGLALFVRNDGTSGESIPLGHQGGALPPPPGTSPNGSEGGESRETEIHTVAFAGEELAPGRDASAKEALGSLRIRVIRKSTGEAAPHQLLRILPFGAQDPFFSVREVFSDRHGEVVVEKLAPGGCYVTAHLGRPARTEIKAGEETPVTVELPRGMILNLRVVDGDDRPIASADIHVSREGSLGDTRKVGVAGPDGRYTLEVDAFETWRCVGARAEGHAPSALHILTGPADIEKTIEVVLDEAGGTVRGIVQGPDGQPVANALVIIGTRDHRQFTLPDGLRACTADPLPLRTDAEGRFEQTSVPPGAHPIRVRARGTNAWEDTLEVTAHQITEVSVSLEEGVTIEGIITGADGKPAERMQILVGQYGSPFSSFTRTDARGRYRLSGAAAGDIEISASPDTTVIRVPLR